MLSKEKPLVGRVDDKRVARQASGVEVVQQPAHVLVNGVHALQVAAHVDLVLRLSQGPSLEVGELLDPALDLLGVVSNPPQEPCPSWHSVSSVPEPDLLQSLAQRNALRYIFMECRGLRNGIQEQTLVLSLRNEDVMRRLVVVHQEKRSVWRAFLKKPQGIVCDDVRDVPLVPYLLRPLAGVAQVWVVVEALAWKNRVVVKAGRFALEMPLPDHARVVTGRLQEFGHGLLRAVESVGQCQDPVLVTVPSGQHHSPARSAD